MRASLTNRWVGILRACLERGCEYDETAAWQQPLKPTRLEAFQPWDV